MKQIWRKLVGPSQSLLLLFDHLAGEAAFEFQEKIEEIGRYYTFGKLSEIVRRPLAPNASGMAAVVFAHARKSVFLKAVPFLRGSGIPFTLFFQPECIGLNRLPAEEELRAYREYYPDKFSDETFANLLEQSWLEPETVETFLRNCRREIGPLPVNHLDPTLFSVTWGKILEIPPPQIELGIHLANSPLNLESTRAAVDFIGMQTKVRPQLAFTTRSLGGQELAIASLRELGIRALMTTGEGIVERNTDPWNLPQWPIRKSEDSASKPLPSP